MTDYFDETDGGWDTDDGIAAEGEIDERANIAEEDAEDDEWADWLDENDDL